MFAVCVCVHRIVTVFQRIKSNQIHKLLREEKDILVEQVATLQFQVDAQNLVVRKLEEKERILQNNLSALEKELRSVILVSSLGVWFSITCPTFRSSVQYCFSTL